MPPTNITLPPFDATSELINDPTAASYIRSHIPHLSPTQPTDDIRAYLLQELQTPVLNELYPHLWLIARKSSDHIDALHVQRVKCRTIIVVEDAKLHLIWYDATIYVKPIPPLLLNHNFWANHLVPQPNTANGNTTGVRPLPINPTTLTEPALSALGFMRTYFHLIKHESDFLLAQESRLLPQNIDYLPLKHLLNTFEFLPPEAVSPRYHFGQLRHTNLNWAVRLFQPASLGSRPSWTYHQRHWQMTQVIRNVGAPLLAVFAIISLALSAMQVVLAATPAVDVNWPSFDRVSLWFSVVVLALQAFVILVVTLGVFFVLLNQLQFSVRQRLR